MALEQRNEIEPVVERFLAGDIDAMESIITQYEAEVFAVALHLTSDNAVAGEVVEEVFVRLFKELSEIYHESLDATIHGLAYEIALGRLLGRINNHVANVEEFCSLNLAGDSMESKETRIICDDEVADQEAVEAYVDRSLNRASLLLNEVSENLVGKRNIC